MASFAEVLSGAGAPTPNTPISGAAASWEGFITSKEAMIADVDRGGTFTGARFYVSDCARPYRCET